MADKPTERTIKSPFLNWLMGALSLAGGIYVAVLCPYLIPFRFLIGVLVMFLTGMFVMVLLPTKITGRPREEARHLAWIVVVITAILHMFHPGWLSGDNFGWVSPVFPIFLLLVLIASVLHVLRIW